MLKYGNRDFRNLQEQVYANMKNIEDIIKGQDIIADYTLQIVGQVDSAEDLPDAETYDGKLGDIYVVGETSPFHGYAFVKVYENENIPSWIDLGAILVQGPQGEQGPVGPEGPVGPQGDQGVPAGFGVPTASIQGGTGTPNVSITASGPNTARVFDFTFYNLKGEKGDPGAGVQDFSASDAGKSLVVNSTGTATEWDFVGLSPEDQEKLDNSLQLPESAPAAQQLVGINTSGEQNALGIGSGLTISNNEIKVVEDTLVLNLSSGQTLDVGEEIAANITNNVYKSILLQNYGGLGHSIEFKLNTLITNIYYNYAQQSLSSLALSGANAYIAFPVVGTGYSSGDTYGDINKTGFSSNIVTYNQGLKLVLTGTVLSIANVSNTPATAIRAKSWARQSLTNYVTSGTLSNKPIMGLSGADIAYGDLCFSWRPDSTATYKLILFKVASRVLYNNEETPNSYILLKGEWVDYTNGTITTYIMKWNAMTDGAYTIKAL